MTERVRFRTEDTYCSVTRYYQILYNDSLSLYVFGYRLGLLVTTPDTFTYLRPRPDGVLFMIKHDMMNIMFMINNRPKNKHFTTIKTD